MGSSKKIKKKIESIECIKYSIQLKILTNNLPWLFNQPLFTQLQHNYSTITMLSYYYLNLSFSKKNQLIENETINL